MPQKIMLQNDANRIQTGPVQFYDKVGQLDSPGLYLRKEDALMIANAIEAIGCHLRADPEHMDSVIYAVYFGRLQAVRDMIRKDV
jgi:hypothetical protein